MLAEQEDDGRMFFEAEQSNESLAVCILWCVMIGGIWPSTQQ
jgi:hypothetical protein